MHGNALLPLLVFLPMICAFASYITGRRNKNLRDIVVLVLCGIELVFAVWSLSFVLKGQTPEFFWDGFCGLGLHFKLDGFRAVYALIAAFMWFMSNGLFAPAYFAAHYHNRNRYYLFTLLTLGATCGVFLGASLYTSFIFFEVMSLTSYCWVAHEEKQAAMRAAETYLAVAIIGGMATLMGLFMLYNRIGTLELEEIYAACAHTTDKKSLYLIAALITSGFAAKAGAFPLHIWLPKAHPVAPAPASALLSGILTKAGIFGVLAVSANILPHDEVWGNAILVIGVITMFVGALLALFSIDLKKTLACSSMSQIGFILVGTAMASLLGHHNGLAAHGALLHMVNHSLIKLTLFMVAGAVYMKLHKLNLNEIRGFGRGKPVLHFAFLMGYLGIIGMPLWNGFVSKSLIHESILEYIELLEESGAAWGVYKVSEMLFLFTGGMTAAYMTKLYVSIFWEKNDKETQKKYDSMRSMPFTASLALVLSAVLLPILGIFCSPVMTKIASLMQGFMRSEGPAHAVHYFSSENLIGAAESLAIGAVLYVFFIRLVLMRKNSNGIKEYVDLWPKWLDLENMVYRPLLETVLPTVCGAVMGLCDHLADYVRVVLNAVATFVVRVFDEGIDGIVVSLKHTLFGAPRKKEPILIGNRLTHGLGVFCDGVVHILNSTVCRHRPIKANFVYIFAAAFDEINANIKKITLSVSFGLLLMCIGLYFAFFYILH